MPDNTNRKSIKLVKEPYDYDVTYKDIRNPGKYFIENLTIVSGVKFNQC